MRFVAEHARKNDVSGKLSGVGQLSAVVDGLSSRAPNNFLQRRLLWDRHYVRYSDSLFKWWYSGYMFGKLISFISVAAIVLLIAIWQMTTPTTIGPLGILAVFILMYVSVLGVLIFLLLGVNKVVVKMSSSVVASPRQEMSIRKAYYYASVLALAPIMIIGMQSVGEVGFYELLLVVIFTTIACVYIAKRTN